MRILSLVLVYLTSICRVILQLIRKMYTARQKIHKDKDLEPSEFEDSVAQVYFYTSLMRVKE